mgnify:CR=1 FL=1
MFSRIFGTTSAPATTTPAAQTATQATTVTPTQQATETTELPPMDHFKDLWNTEGNQEVDTTLPANMFAGVDPTKMLAAARKVDFSKSIPPEVLSKITAGGPEAAQAFAQALNDVSQRSYAQSSFAATKIVEQALAKFEEGMNNRLPTQMKSLQVADSLRESNPALNHPAAAPIVQALQAQFTTKFPNASATEIRQMATDYLTQFSQLVTPKQAAPAVPASENWEGFFSESK